MDNIGGEQVVGSLVTCGANVSMPPDRVHRGVVVIDSGNGFRTVTLAAVNPGPVRVETAGISRMALNACGLLIKLNPCMGVRQAASNTHRGSGRTYRKEFPQDTRRFELNIRALKRSDFVAFKIPVFHQIITY